MSAPVMCKTKRETWFDLLDAETYHDVKEEVKSEDEMSDNM